MEFRPAEVKKLAQQRVFGQKSPPMFKGLIDWYMATLDQGGYWLVGLLMAIESSIVPLPSEVVVPPAALETLDCQEPGDAQGQ